MLKTKSKQVHMKHYIYLHIILTQYNTYQKVHIFWSYIKLIVLKNWSLCWQIRVLKFQFFFSSGEGILFCACLLVCGKLSLRLLKSKMKFRPHRNKKLNQEILLLELQLMWIDFLRFSGLISQITLQILCCCSTFKQYRPNKLDLSFLW